MFVLVSLCFFFVVIIFSFVDCWVICVNKGICYSNIVCYCIDDFVGL